VIADVVLRAINGTLSDLMPPKHGFCLVVFETSPTRWMPDISTTVDVVACGSFFEASPQEKAAVATALHELAASLDADAQASASPE
jgi:hypothetical protein